MPTKPRTAAGYEPAQVVHVRATCLYVATRLGDLTDELVIVGGLVPSLIVDQTAAATRHVGTADLDVGLALAVFDAKRYQALTERLRQAGFAPDTNDRGNLTRQRWSIDGPPRISVDFLVAPTDASERGGRLKSIQPDFAAIIAPGLTLAFLDRVRVPLDGQTIRGEHARREVWVSGPGAFVAMKALAFRARGENKDAYDLTYVLQNYKGRSRAVAQHLVPLRAAAEAAQALQVLDEDFAAAGSLGPCRVAEFVHGRRDDAVEADAWGAVRDLIEELSTNAMPQAHLRAAIDHVGRTLARRFRRADIEALVTVLHHRRRQSDARHGSGDGVRSEEEATLSVLSECARGTRTKSPGDRALTALRRLEAAYLR
ncbi:MAG TPA: hypothetical protein VHV30_11905 [Polyangiaceae bacterium]|jgi:predicted nucleotidyltransferase|nr:hypothetical protein [Polyangiaceae bacterium]